MQEDDENKVKVYAESYYTIEDNQYDDSIHNPFIFNEEAKKFITYKLDENKYLKNKDKYYNI